MKAQEAVVRLSRGRFMQAYRGTKRSVRGESSFFVHFFSAAALCIAAAALGASLLDWAILLLCITGVIAAEMFHAATIRLCGLLPPGESGAAREVADISQAAVMVVSLGAAIVCLLLLAHRLGVVLGGG
jgi:diacylglycerol kinase